MPSARPVRPTDLVALVAYDGQVYPNESVTRDRIGEETSPHPLGTALEQWFSFATGRNTWISVKGATLRGLVSARRRGSKAAWELDCLIDAADDDPGVMTSLLDQAARDAGEAGVEKIFLRLASESGLVTRAGSAGFSVYLRERLLACGTVRDREANAGHDEAGELRRWSRADTYATFQLYNRWAPEEVRRVEAATFREWIAARERVSRQRGARQTVVERDGRVVGWLRTAASADIGRFDMMVDASHPETADMVIDRAVMRLSKQEALFTLAPEFAVGPRERLQRRGFEERGEFVVLVRRTTLPVTAPELAPVSPL